MADTSFNEQGTTFPYHPGGMGHPYDNANVEKIEAQEI